MATPESDDHNEELDFLTINKAIIDAAGVEHDGELADLADTGGDGGSGTSFSVSDDDATVLDDPTDLNFGEYLSAADDGDGTITLTGTNTDTNTHLDLEDESGSNVVGNPDALRAGRLLSFTDNGNNTATIDADGAVGSDDVGEIYLQSSEPSNPSTGDLWIDTSGA